MRVYVTLFTILRRYGEDIGPDGSLLLPDNQTLADLCARLAIPGRLGKVFLVNGRPRPAEWVPVDGDRIQVFAFIGGG